MKKLTTLLAVSLIVIGIALGGWSIWKTYGTDVLASKEQTEAVMELKNQWEAKPAPEPVASGISPEQSPEASPEQETKPLSGQAYGILRIPRFGGEYEKPLLEGFGSGSEALSKSNALLEEGVVHYATSAHPGEQGNFAISGHRNGHGAVFNKVMDLRLGDEIFVETVKGAVAYKVIQEGRNFSPDDTRYIDGDPLSDEESTSRYLMTLTSCENWDASQRVAVILELAD